MKSDFSSPYYPLTADMTVIIIIAAFLLMNNCSDRERTNPFDPNNPFTHGAPTNVRVKSHRNTIELRWSKIDVEDLSHYQISRAIENEELDSFRTLSADTNFFFDTPVDYDTTYRYAVQAFTEYDAGTLSDTVKTIPGPVNFVIADFYNFVVRKLTYDAEYIMAVNYFPSPIAVETHLQEGNIYIAEYWSQQITVTDPELNPINTLELNDRPIDFALDAVNQQLYILGFDQNQLIIITTLGAHVESISLPFQLAVKSHICYDSLSSCAWISVSGRDSLLQVQLYDTYQVHVYPGIIDPKKVYPDPIDGGCWTATDSGIINLSPDGHICRYFEDRYITDISINQQNGDIYYIAYHSDTESWETGYLDRSFDYVTTPILGNETPDQYHIQVIPGNGQRGFLTMQIGSWNLLRFDNSGNKIGESGWYSSRLDIALE